MNWNSTAWLELPPPERGRPGERLIRGLIWAVVAITIISILVFCIAIFGSAFSPCVCTGGPAM